MGIVVGPYDHEDWYTMLSLKADMDFMKKRDREKFDIAIRWTRKKLKELYARAA